MLAAVNPIDLAGPGPGKMLGDGILDPEDDLKGGSLGSGADDLDESILVEDPRGSELEARAAHVLGRSSSRAMIRWQRGSVVARSSGMKTLSTR
jgi:hypothetical protein